ncbi:hypothetical protein BJX76DRAFT_318513 [Aspergillus varians]
MCGAMYNMGVWIVRIAYGQLYYSIPNFSLSFGVLRTSYSDRIVTRFNYLSRPYRLQLHLKDYQWNRNRAVVLRIMKKAMARWFKSKGYRIY